ncbi:uncharacterized protein MKK02DRAFT_33857 [Dioszegia hungarica]|uniref:Uncharacterized protein n=1 Tax=Dioszegia hungarica TaxID=4972 RepID=A0AA38H9I3_9TREE|nr:uncharacterized protein MKK02DRAFT_33857 [Dioszegia hungarica]KAI9636730.1 hypothetical protein MKK02DRAFT_33857 [Dioszegia hungarica]
MPANPMYELLMGAEDHRSELQQLRNTPFGGVIQVTDFEERLRSLNNVAHRRLANHIADFLDFPSLAGGAEDNWARLIAPIMYQINTVYIALLDQIDRGELTRSDSSSSRVRVWDGYFGDCFKPVGLGGTTSPIPTPSHFNTTQSTGILADTPVVTEQNLAKEVKAMAQVVVDEQVEEVRQLIAAVKKEQAEAESRSAEKIKGLEEALKEQKKEMEEMKGIFESAIIAEVAKRDGQHQATLEELRAQREAAAKLDAGLWDEVEALRAKVVKVEENTSTDQFLVDAAILHSNAIAEICKQQIMAVNIVLSAREEAVQHIDTRVGFQLEGLEDLVDSMDGRMLQFEKRIAAAIPPPGGSSNLASTPSAPTPAAAPGYGQFAFGPHANNSAPSNPPSAPPSHPLATGSSTTTITVHHPSNHVTVKPPVDSAYVPWMPVQYSQ